MTMNRKDSITYLNVIRIPMVKKVPSCQMNDSIYSYGYTYSKYKGTEDQAQFHREFIKQVIEHRVLWYQLFM
jgi:hypothetical protein